MGLRTLRDISDLNGRRVFLRVDANVPLDGNRITDDGRIRAFLPTLKHLVDAGAIVIVGSHLGRPKSAADTQFSMGPVVERIRELTGYDASLISAVSGTPVSNAVSAADPGQVLVLENVRFDPRETSKDDAERQELASEWAESCDLVVSDGFGVVHRKQASVYDLPLALPSYAGYVVEKEVEVVTRLTSSPEPPYTVVLGGSKVSDKLGVITALLPRANAIAIGGGMVFTVLKAQGFSIGKSLLEEDMLPTVEAFLGQAESLGVHIALPSDIVMAESFAQDAAHETLSIEHLEEGTFGANAIGLDIGPESARQFASLIEGSQTVFWNGPMGVFEFDAFSHGTRAVASALTRVAGLSVVGGGDSAAAVRQLGFRDDQFGHISTGGGASLEFLEGKSLPGLEVLGWST